MSLLVLTGTCEHKGGDVASLATIQDRLFDDLYRQGFDGEIAGNLVTFGNGHIRPGDWHRYVGVDGGQFEVLLREDGGEIRYTLHLKQLAVMIVLMIASAILVTVFLIGLNAEAATFYIAGGVLGFVVGRARLRWRNRRFLRRVLRAS